MLLALQRLADSKHACGPPSLGTGWLDPTTSQRKERALRKCSTKLSPVPSPQALLDLGHHQRDMSRAGLCPQAPPQQTAPTSDPDVVGINFQPCLLFSCTRLELPYSHSFKCQLGTCACHLPQVPHCVPSGGGALCPPDSFCSCIHQLLQHFSYDNVQDSFAQSHPGMSPVPLSLSIPSAFQRDRQKITDHFDQHLNNCRTFNRESISFPLAHSIHILS